MIAAGVAPASAEFFGCNEPHTKVTYYRGYYPQRHHATHYAFAMRRPRHTVYASHLTVHRAGWWR